jgi:hypothetical protein
MAVGTVLTALLSPSVELIRWRGCSQDVSELSRCRLAPLAAGEETEVELVVEVDVDAEGELALTLNALSPSVPGSPSVAAVTQLLPAVLRLHNGRFAVRVAWRNKPSGSFQAGLVVPHSEVSGAFYFFTEENLEVVVKVLDGGNVNGSFGVVYTGLTGFEYDIFVTDLETGALRTYHHAADDPCGGQDRRAFAGADGSAALPPVTPPAATPSAAACTPGPLTLCLGGGRFRVEAYWWRQEQAEEGTALAASVTGDSGFFSFSNPEAPDLVVKLIDARQVNERFWFFAGSLSGAEYWITVSDVETGLDRHYSHAVEPLCGITDVNAFEP